MTNPPFSPFERAQLRGWCVSYATDAHKINAYGIASVNASTDTIITDARKIFDFMVEGSEQPKVLQLVKKE